MSIAAVQARIASLQALAPPVAPPVRRTPAAGGPTSTSFAAHLDAAASSAGPLPPAAERWRGAIEQAAGAAGIDPNLVSAVAWTESGFDATAVSHAGAVGLMQLMPGTAAGLGVDPRDPVQNLHGGARYLAEQVDRFGGLDLALAAYNAGPGAVADHGGIPPYPETQAYVRKVLDRYETIR